MNSENRTRTTLGVLGGMGPLASAEFLKTIYEHSLGAQEQAAPVVVVYSDPSFPDRTEMLLQGRDEILLDKLIEAISRLLDFGSTKVVVCCVTIHHLLPRLPPRLRDSVVSLLDVIADEVVRTQRRYLLACTSGTRDLRLFQDHERWNAIKHHVVLLDRDDQQRIHHDFIYQVKKNCDVRELVPKFEMVLEKYDVDAFIAGCTEMHILAKQFITRYGLTYGCLDPLTIIARKLAANEL